MSGFIKSFNLYNKSNNFDSWNRYSRLRRINQSKEIPDYKKRVFNIRKDFLIEIIKLLIKTIVVNS